MKIGKIEGFILRKYDGRFCSRESGVNRFDNRKKSCIMEASATGLRREPEAPDAENRRKSDFDGHPEGA